MVSIKKADAIVLQNLSSLCKVCTVNQTDLHQVLPSESKLSFEGHIKLLQWANFEDFSFG